MNTVNALCTLFKNSTLNSCSKLLIYLFQIRFEDLSSTSSYCTVYWFGYSL